MADTAKRLAGPSQLPTAASTAYTVPGGTTAIVRNMHFVNTTGADKALTLSIGVDAAGTRLYSATPIAANGTLDWNGFCTLAAAEIIQWFSDVAGITGSISGVEVV